MKKIETFEEAFLNYSKPSTKKNINKSEENFPLLDSDNIYNHTKKRNSPSYPPPPPVPNEFEPGLISLYDNYDTFVLDPLREEEKNVGRYKHPLPKCNDCYNL